MKSLNYGLGLESWALPAEEGTTSSGAFAEELTTGIGEALDFSGVEKAGFSWGGVETGVDAGCGATGGEGAFTSNWRSVCCLKSVESAVENRTEWTPPVLLLLSTNRRMRYRFACPREFGFSKSISRQKLAANSRAMAFGWLDGAQEKIQTKRRNESHHEVSRVPETDKGMKKYNKPCTRKFSLLVLWHSLEKPLKCSPQFISVCHVCVNLC